MTSHCGKSARTNFFFGFSFAPFFFYYYCLRLFTAFELTGFLLRNRPRAPPFLVPVTLKEPSRFSFFGRWWCSLRPFLFFFFVGARLRFRPFSFLVGDFIDEQNVVFSLLFFFKKQFCQSWSPLLELGHFFFLWTDWKFPAPFPFPLRSAALVWSITANQRPNWIQSNENIRMLWAVFTRISLVTKQRGRSNMKRVFLL